MEIGNQIKALRTQRHITQETLAVKLGVSAQAVSKWETLSATPDIQLLPEISAFFGVSIDELFALSDETRMERIKNMLWDERVLNPATVEREREFLLEKGRREPENSRVYLMLSDIESQLSDEHRTLSAAYAREAIRRDPNNINAHSAYVTARRGITADFCVDNKWELIDFYKDFVAAHPENRSGYMWLLDQLIDDHRLTEARAYYEKFIKLDTEFRAERYEGKILWAEGRHGEAMEVWEKMCEKYPDSWQVHLSMGEFLVMEERYEEAKAHYRLALDKQSPPRYTDGSTSIAQICELQGDYAGAIAAHEEEMEILRNEWDTADGEMIDQHLREIERLKARMK